MVEQKVCYVVLFLDTPVLDCVATLLVAYEVVKYVPRVPLELVDFLYWALFVLVELERVEERIDLGSAIQARLAHVKAKFCDWQRIYFL